MSELSCFFFELKKKRFYLYLSVVSLASLGVDLLFSVDNGEKERNKEGGGERRSRRRRRRWTKKN